MNHNEQMNPIYALAAADEQLIFAASQNGLQISQNGGDSWRDAYESLRPPQPLPTFSVALSPNFAEDNVVVAGVPGGIVRSTNGGTQWQPSILPEPAPVVSSLLFTADGTLLAGTVEDGVFRSRNQGKRWVTWNFGLLDMHINCLALAKDETIYAGTESGVFISRNNGRSWQDIPFAAELAPVLAIALVTDKILLVGTETHGLLLSEDGGLTWQNTAFTTGMVDAITIQQNKWHLIHDGVLHVSVNDGQTWESDSQFDVPVTALNHGREALTFLGLTNGHVVNLDK